MKKFLGCLVLASMSMSAYAAADSCVEVHRRPIVGLAGDTPPVVERDSGWADLAQVYGPFGYSAPDPKPATIRKWRLYSLHWDENAGEQVNLQVRFDLQGDNDPIFTLPQIAGGWGWRGEGFSDWFQFGSGSARDTNKSHAVVQVRLNSKALYNNHGLVSYAALVAYDCR